MANFNLAERLRQNHAIEHATLTLLSERLPQVQLVARSDFQGFVAFGDVNTGDLRDAAEEAIGRLRGGEARLAVHANCGTNLVAAGTLSALGAMLFGAGRRRSLWERVPSAVLGATAALMFAGPAGRWLQANVTTSPHVDGLRIASVERLGDTPVVRHRVAISD